MAYKRSGPLLTWLDSRQRAIRALATGHAHVGIVAGRGRPLDQSKPLAHAHLIVTVGQFQGFVRDLHDLAVERLIDVSGVDASFKPILTAGLTQGRGIDRGNATHATIKSDFKRIGLTPFTIGACNAQWASDEPVFGLFVELRNVLAHGNEDGLARLLATRPVKDTVTWTRRNLPVLNRYGRALDELVWNHLKMTTGKAPW